MLTSSVRRGKDVSAFIGGLFLGAIATAVAFMVVGSVLRWPLPGAARTALAVAIVGVLVLRELGLVRFPVWQNKRLVPQYVALTPVWGALQFGAEMGTGMRTYSPTGLPHAVVACLLLLAGWPAALLAGAGFALGRAIMVLSFVLARDTEAADRAFSVALKRYGWAVGALFAVPAVGMLAATPAELVRYTVAGLLAAAVIAKLVRWRRFVARLGTGTAATALAVVTVAVEAAGAAAGFASGLVPTATAGLIYVGFGVAFIGVQTFWAVGGRGGCPCFGADEPVWTGWARAAVVLAAGIALSAPALL